MKKTIITTVIATTLAIIFAYHAYMVYQLRAELTVVESVVSTDHATLEQIVALINQSRK